MGKKKTETLISDYPEIDYSSLEDKEILRGKYMGEDILIYYYGEVWHPCAYLKIKQPCLWIEDNDEPCHWWITFSEEIQWDEKWNNWRFDKWYWIWWDYAHFNDYMRILWRWKMRTTKEILKDIENMILWSKKMWFLD